MLAGTMTQTLKARRRGVRTKFIWGSDLIANEVPEVMYRRDQLYATAAAAGAFTVLLVHPYVTPFQAQASGAAVVILAGLYNVHRERLRRAQERAAKAVG